MRLRSYLFHWVRTFWPLYSVGCVERWNTAPCIWLICWYRFWAVWVRQNSCLRVWRQKREPLKWADLEKKHTEAMLLVSLISIIVWKLERRKTELPYTLLRKIVQVCDSESKLSIHSSNLATLMSSVAAWCKRRVTCMKSWLVSVLSVPRRLDLYPRCLSRTRRRLISPIMIRIHYMRT